MKTDHPKPSQEPVAIGLVCGGHFFSHFYGLVLPSLFPLMAGALDVGYSALGLLLGVMAASSALLQIPAGVLVDRFGPVWPLVVGLTLRAGAVLLMGLAPSYWQLWVLAALAGIGNSVFHPADYAILAAKVRKPRRGRAFALHSFAGHLGWALAPVLMGLGVALGSWREALLAAGAAGLVMAAILVLHRRQLTAGAKPQPGPEDAAEQPGRLGPSPVFASLPLLVFFLVFLLDALAMKGFQTVLVPAVVLTHGATLAAAGALLSGFFASSALGILAGGLLADRSAQLSATVALSLLATAVFIALMPAAAGLAALGLLSVLAGFCHGLLPPSRDLVVQALAPEGATGRVFAFVSVGFDMGSTLAPLLFGLLMDRGQAGLVFWLAAASLALAAGAALLPGLCSAVLRPGEAGFPGEGQEHHGDRAGDRHEERSGLDLSGQHSHKTAGRRPVKIRQALRNSNRGLP